MYKTHFIGALVSRIFWHYESMKLNVVIYMHIAQYIRINKQIWFHEKKCRFVVSKFVRLSDELIRKSEKFGRVSIKLYSAKTLPIWSFLFLPSFLKEETIARLKKKLNHLLVCTSQDRSHQVWILSTFIRVFYGPLSI